MWPDSYSVGGGFGALLALALLVLGVVYLVRARDFGQGQSARSLWRARYAREESDQAAFETRQRALQTDKTAAENHAGNGVSRE